MPKSIELHTEGIPITTGEMTAIGLGAIKQEAEERERRLIAQQRTDALNARDSFISYFFGRILQESKAWEHYYDAEFNKKSPLKKR